MNKLSQIVLASNNQGKIKEFKQLFEPFQIEIIPQSNLNIPEVNEPFPTFVENALIKARNASKISGLPALADDSGICATALNNRPGVLSARFAGEHGNDKKNNAKLSIELKTSTNLTVFYYCCIVFIRDANDPTPLIAEGKWFGQWSFEPHGQNGFGYDPHVYLPELQLTVAQLSSTQKNQLSHRGKAVVELLDKLSLNP